MSGQLSLLLLFLLCYFIQYSSMQAIADTRMIRTSAVPPSSIPITSRSTLAMSNNEASEPEFVIENNETADSSTTPSALYRPVFCPGTEVRRKCYCAATIDYYCPAGSYCPLPGNPGFQIKCSLGFYCPENTSQATYCCAGHYCPEPSHVELCPEGSFCRVGVIAPKECNIFTPCPRGTSTPKSLTILPVIASVLLCVIGGIVTIRCFKYRVHKQRSAKIEQRKLYLKSEIQQNPHFRDIERAHSNPNNITLPNIERVQSNPSSVMTSSNTADWNMIRERSSTKYDIEFKDLGLILRNKKVLMEGVTGSIKHGRVTAIMGPSGAGKTTFINLISGKVKKTSGTILVNGVEEEQGLQKYHRLVGYVPQEDIMMRWATVYSNLEFSAKTRLDWSIPAKQRTDLIYRVIDVLGLNDVVNSVIGDDKKRGISGGQRKRVNIGIELVSDPKVLILDEPTSGLDSSSAKDVCLGLRRIAASGITVICVIHQPNYEIFEMFDDLILLGKGGRTVYMGPTLEAERYFEGMGFQCPARVNPADFIMDVVAGKVSPVNSQLEEYNSRDLFDLWEQNILHMALMGESEIVAQNPQNRKSILKKWKQRTKNLQKEEEEKNILLDFISNIFFRILELCSRSWNGICDTIHSCTHKNPYRILPPFYVTFWYCFLRACNQIFSRKADLVLGTVLHIFLGYFISLAISGIMFVGPIPDFIATSLCPLQNSDTCIQPISDEFQGAGQFISWAIGFAGITTGAVTFGEEKVVAWREAASGLNSASYFIAKVVCDLPKVLIAAALFIFSFGISYWPQGNPGHLYVTCLCLYLNSFVLGYIISMFVSVELAALLGVAVSLLFSLVLSGVSPSLPKSGGFQDVLYSISYPRWAIEALVITEWGAYSYENLTEQLSRTGYNLDNYGKDIGIMLAIWIVWLGIAYLCLRISMRKRR